MHNDLTSLVIHRVKNIAGYPESSAEILLHPTLLENLDLYGDGDVRAMEVRGSSRLALVFSLLEMAFCCLLSVSVMPSWQPVSLGSS